jgi:hypothetical protein
MPALYPLTSETGNLTTGGSVTTGDLYYLLGTSLRMTTDLATLNVNANEVDITQATTSGVNMMEKLNGLRDATVDFSGIWPRTPTGSAMSALVSFASGYTFFVNAFTIDITWPEIDITSFTGTASTGYRTWMPGGTGSWSGSYTCKADAATPLSMPSIGAAAASTFKFYEDGTNDPTLSGNIGTPKLSQKIKIGDYSEATYSFSGSGNLQQKSGDALPGLLYAGTALTNITKPSWDLNSDGVADNTCVLNVSSTRYYTFPAFWTKLSLSWKPDDVVRVNGTLRVAGAISVT